MAVIQFIAALVLARAAGIALLWIARPAAGAELPPLTSSRAGFELAAGVLAALLTGWRAPLLLAALLIVLRVVLGLSYRAWGGIHRASLIWARASMAALGLLIARLPESYLYSGAR